MTENEKDGDREGRREEGMETQPEMTNPTN